MSHLGTLVKLFLLPCMSSFPKLTRSCELVSRNLFRNSIQVLGQVLLKKRSFELILRDLLKMNLDTQKVNRLNDVTVIANESTVIPLILFSITRIMFVSRADGISLGSHVTGAFYADRLACYRHRSASAAAATAACRIDAISPASICLRSRA